MIKKEEDIKVSPENSLLQNESAFYKRRRIIYLFLMILIGGFSWGWKMGIYSFGTTLLVAIIFLGIILTLINKASEIFKNHTNNDWVTHVIFEAISSMLRITKWGEQVLTKVFHVVHRFAIVSLFFLAIIFIITNTRQLISLIEIPDLVKAILGNKEIIGHIAWGDGFSYSFLVILIILLLPKLSVVLRTWKNNAGTIFAVCMVYPTFLFLMELSKMRPELMSTPPEYTVYLIGIIAVTSEILWISQIVSEKGASKTIQDDFKSKYIVRNLKHFPKNPSEAFQAYEKWKRGMHDSSKFLENNIPYLIDTPIIGSNADILGFKKIAENIFQYIIGIELEGSSSAIVIGLDGPRGSGKTSITNMLKNDYLVYTKERLPSFEFRAWSYPRGSIVECFLKDFGKFCEASEIPLERDLGPYIESLSKVHGVLGGLKLFIGDSKTDSERINEISSSIQKSGKKIVIIIDDVDRISNQEDLESLLKLLRSTANFHGVFYILNYSSSELLKSSKQNSIGALSDFETKFLNWKIKMPEMEMIGFGQTEVAESLTNMMFDELENRGKRVFGVLFEKEKDFINQQFEELKSLVNKLEWKQPQAKINFLQFLDNDRLDMMITYLQKSGFDCTQTYVDHSYVIESLKDNNTKQKKQFEGIKTPRTVKYIVNESLRLLDNNNSFLQDFFADMQRLISDESFDSSIIDGPLRTDLDIGSINTSFGKRLKENLRNCTFVENVVRE